MHDVLYLHGFGQTQPECCTVAQQLKMAVPSARLHTPCYHPGGKKTATRIGVALDHFERIIEHTTSKRVHLVGYSFGGLLAAILAWRRQDLIENVLLLAPAIDNFVRNYEGRDTRYMPPEYVAELQTFPARPDVRRPTTLVHGILDKDTEGSAPCRIREWATEQSFENVYLLQDVGHSLEPWISSPDSADGDRGNTPTFRQLVKHLIPIDE